MKIKLIIGGIMIILVVGLSILYLNNRTQSLSTRSNQYATSVTSAVKKSVVIHNFNFSPSSLIIKTGEKVKWTNQDTVAHSATADDNSFDTGILSNGQSNTNTFTRVGTYSYHCSIHPNMTGTIIVQ